MDEELRALAGLALRSAFYARYSALVLAFEQEGKGLEGSGNPDYYTEQLQTMSSVYSIDKSVKPAAAPKVEAKVENLPFARVKVHSLRSALLNKQALDIWLDGKHIFQRRNGEWFYVA